MVTVPVHASCHDVQRVLAAVATNGLPPSHGLPNTGQLLPFRCRNVGISMEPPRGYDHFEGFVRSFPEELKANKILAIHISTATIIKLK